MASNTPKIQRIALISRVFTPGAPIDEPNLFRGRIPQMQDVISAVAQRGYHVGLYGERGVGKTSLASVLPKIFDLPESPLRAVLVTCNTESTYQSVWRDIYRELDIEHNAAELAPEDVRYTMARLDPPALIVIDELDRLEDNDSLTLLADTIKAFSDHVVASTLVLVGVAYSLGDLIGEHESIVRNIAQVEIPRMSPKELNEILVTGCEQCELTIHDDAATKIIYLSEGLPHYTHLLGLNAGRRVIQDDRDEITLSDVDAAIPLAVEKHTIRSDYLRATQSPRVENLFPHVLLACALAQKNDLGYFTAGAIRGPLEVIAGRRIEIPQFARHLNQFLAPERGAILRREGEKRRYIYRFTEPILEPYVVLNGLATGLITDEQLIEIQGEPAPMDATSEPERLF